MSYVDVSLGSIFVYTLMIIISSIGKPSKEINNTRGYRTPLSMKNQKNWDYANKIAPQIMFKSFLLGMMLLQLCLFFLDDFATTDQLVAFVLLYFIINCIFPIFLIERKLVKFDKTNLDK